MKKLIVALMLVVSAISFSEGYKQGSYDNLLSGAKKFYKDRISEGTVVIEKKHRLGANIVEVKVDGILLEAIIQGKNSLVSIGYNDNKKSDAEEFEKIAEIGISEGFDLTYSGKDFQGNLMLGLSNDKFERIWLTRLTECHTTIQMYKGYELNPNIKTIMESYKQF